MTTQRRGALVTGGSRGIGRAAVHALARMGCSVVVNYRSDQSAAEAAVAEARTLGGDAIAIQADVSDAGEVERLWNECVQHIGAVDVLVNNAGIAPLTPLDDISLDEWQLVLDTNLRSAFLLSRNALGPMRDRRWGRILTVTSQAGITGGFFVGAHYAASKGALIALSRTLAKHGAQFGVTSNCIAPGLVDTDLVAGFPEDRRDAMIGGIPMRRLGTIDEVAGLIGFLASDAASYITGTTIPVDGGLLSG